MLCPRFLTLPRDDSDCCPMSHGGYFAESSFFVFCSPYKEVLKSLEPHVIELYFERLNSGDVTACGVWENNPVIAACGHFYDLTSQVHSIPRSIEWDLWIKADIVSNRDFTDLEKMCIVANGFVAHGNAETGVYEQKIGDAFHRVCKLPASKFGGVSVRQWLLAYSRALAMLACIEDPEFESQSALDDRLNHEQSMHRADNFFYSFPVEARNVRQSIITSSNRIHRAWRAILVANGRMSEECKTLPFVPPLFLDVKSTRLSPGFLSDILVPTLNKWGFHITSILSFDLKQLPHYPPCQTSSDSTNKNKEEEEEEEEKQAVYLKPQTVHIPDSFTHPPTTRSTMNQSDEDLPSLYTLTFPPPFKNLAVHTAGDVLQLFKSGLFHDTALSRGLIVCFNASTLLRAIKIPTETAIELVSPSPPANGERTVAGEKHQVPLTRPHLVTPLATEPTVDLFSIDLPSTEGAKPIEAEFDSTELSEMRKSGSEQQAFKEETEESSEFQWVVEVDPKIHQALLAIRLQTKCTLQVYLQEHLVDPACILAIMRYCASPQGKSVLNGGFSYGGVEGRAPVSASRFVSLPSSLTQHWLCSVEDLNRVSRCAGKCECYDLRAFNPRPSPGMILCQPRVTFDEDGKRIFTPAAGGEECSTAEDDFSSACPFDANIDREKLFDLAIIKPSQLAVPLIDGRFSKKTVSLLLAVGGQELVGRAWNPSDAPALFSELFNPATQKKGTSSSESDKEKTLALEKLIEVNKVESNVLNSVTVVEIVHPNNTWSDGMKRVVVQGCLSVIGGVGGIFGLMNRNK